MAALITVIICTHNRAIWLREALASLAAQSAAFDSFDIVVVDNASHDHTQDVVKQFATARNVRYVYEERLGIAIARNRGWQEAQTEFVVYLDDDARADPAWVTTFLETFQTLRPSPACVTGAIDLDWIGGRPAWYPAEYESLLARYDFGPGPKWHDEHGYLLTCNAAFRRQILADLGGFMEGLGHRGAEVHGGEDNEMFSRLMARGLPVYYQPQARVSHITPPERQTRRYLLQRIFASGLTQAFLDQLRRAPRQAGIGRRVWWDLLMAIRYLLQAMFALATLQRPVFWSHVYCFVQKLGRLRSEFALAGWPLTARDRQRVQQIGSVSRSKV
jgi:glycosyltransferase involved in cell wall biosynthesis